MYRFRSVLFSALLLSATVPSVCVLAAPQHPARSRTTSKVAPPSDKNLPNFAVVDKGIYRGAAPTEEGLRRLKALGVRTIIDLRIERKGQTEEANAARDLGMERIRIPMGREAPTKKQVQTFLTALNKADHSPVFVHCQHGADRTGAMIGIWRETRDGWDFDRAYKEMRHYGFNPHLWELKGAVANRRPAPAH